MSRIDNSPAWLHKVKLTSKSVFKNSIFGALFTLWTAPIDNPKLDISKVKKDAKITNTWFFNNLIIGIKR